MVTMPTVLILGAGASSPYGYPLGDKLVSKILQSLGRPNPDDFTHHLIGAGISEAALRDFANELRQSQVYSVDSFLENRYQEFGEIGKLAIAAALMPQEDESNLFAAGDWYRYLFNQICNIAGEKACHRLSIITYNYDRSLDHYLYKAIKSKYGLDNESAAKRAAEIEIVHLHGHLGELPHQAPAGRPYSSSISPFTLRAAASNIRIIHEDIGNQPQFKRALQLLQEAQVVCFLGFSFHRINLDRLSLDSWVHTKRAIFGSAFNLTEAERAHFTRRFYGRLQLGLPTYDAHEFLRHHAVLS